jgi:hypothetical protein
MSSSHGQEPGAIVHGIDFAYKIVADPLPSPLPHTLPLSSLDAQDGFIHLSLAHQTPHTADLYFADVPTLWLLRLDVHQLGGHPDGGDFKWAPTPDCVHLYAREKGHWARLGDDTITGVRICTKVPNGNWVNAMQDLVLEGWLVWSVSTCLIIRRADILIWRCRGQLRTGAGLPGPKRWGGSRPQERVETGVEGQTENLLKNDVEICQ